MRIKVTYSALYKGFCKYLVLYPESSLEGMSLVYLCLFEALEILLLSQEGHTEIPTTEALMRNSQVAKRNLK